LLETRLLQELCLSQAGGTAGAAAYNVVAAGVFQISGGSATPVGPTLNDLSASPGGSPGTFLLDWTGSPAYVNPNTSPPGPSTYVVKGTAMGSIPGLCVVQVVGFQDAGILIAVQGATANGFMVEISELS